MACWNDLSWCGMTGLLIAFTVYTVALLCLVIRELCRR